MHYMTNMKQDGNNICFVVPVHILTSVHAGTQDSAIGCASDSIIMCRASAYLTKSQMSG